MAALDPNPYTLIAILAAIYIVLGTALDGISMIVLTTSIVMPMVAEAGFDLVWFGIFIVLLVEIAELTPPLGFNLFVLQTMSGRDSNYVALGVDAVFLPDGARHRADHGVSRDRDLAAGHPDRRRRQIEARLAGCLQA